MENIYLSHNTARWYWANAKAAPATASTLQRSGALNAPVSTQSDVRFLIGGTLFADKKLDVMIDARGTANVQGITFHFESHEYPDTAFIRLAKQIYIASPELTFLQVAQTSSLIQTIEYGTNLCGKYMIAPERKGGTAPRAAITTKQKIADFLAGCTGVKGIKQAQKALSYVLENAASPFETKGSLILSLPMRYGGYGLKGLRLNFRIDIPEDLQYVTDHSYIEADYLWENTHIAAEYESDEWHSGSDQNASDGIRANALKALGYTSFVITTTQIKSSKECERIAKVVFDQLVKEPGYSRYLTRRQIPENFDALKENLRKELGL